MGVLAGAALGFGVGAGLRRLLQRTMDYDADAAHGLFIGGLSAICAGVFSSLVADTLFTGVTLTSAFGFLGFFVGYWKVGFAPFGSDSSGGGDGSGGPGGAS